MQGLNWNSYSRGSCLASVYLFIYLTSHLSCASPLQLKQWSAVDSDYHLSSYLVSGTTVLNRRDENNDDHDMMSSDGSHMDHSSHGTVEWVPTPPNSSILDQAPDQETRDRWSTYDATSYFTWPEHSGWLFSQFAFILLAWGFAYPVTLAFASAESPLYIPAHLIFLGFYGLSLFTASVYNQLVPNMYPGNCYSTFLFVATILVICHLLLSIFRLVNRYLSPSGRYVAGVAESEEYNPNCYMMSDLETSHSGSSASTAAPSTPMMHMSAESDDHRPPREFDSPDGSVASESTVDDQHGFFAFNQETNTPSQKPRWLFGANWFENKICSRLVSTGVTKTRPYRAILAVSKVLYPVFNLPLFILGMWHFSLALVIYNCMGKGKFVFSLLAHFIKGGIFFLYGLFALSRYLGVCADYGWAWNLRPVRRIGIFRGPTMEFVESGLIFTYGITNVFLERLGNEDGIWNHKDLQHVSIAFMYFGGGLCGLLVESKKIRRILNKSTSSYRSKKTQPNGQQAPPEEEDNEGCFSFNPFPAFIVFWTGILMSKHSQEMALSTEIHAEWGYLFVAAAICRIITYLTYFVAPPSSTLPGRPLTELLTSFCLICGGLVFMSSNKETVPALMNRGLDSMFTLNVTVGFSALIMAWEVIVLVLKNWAAK